MPNDNDWFFDQWEKDFDKQYNRITKLGTTMAWAILLGYIAMICLIVAGGVWLFLHYS